MRVLNAALSRIFRQLRGLRTIRIQSRSRSEILDQVQWWCHVTDAIGSKGIEAPSYALLVGLARWGCVMYRYVFRDDASAGSAGEIGAADQSPLQTHPGTSRFPQTLTGEVLEGAQVW